MLNFKTQLSRGMALLALIVLTAGCFQAAGNGLPSNAIAEDIATFTPLPPPASNVPDIQPSNTPLPPPPPANTDIPEQQIAVVPSPTLPPPPTNIPPPTPIPTDLPPALPTAVPFPTLTPVVIAQAQQPTPDPNTIGTGGAVDPQQQQQQAVDINAQQPITDIEMTSTQRVFEATQTRAAELTQTAVGQGFQPFTVEPTIDPFAPVATLVPTFTPVPVFTGNCVHEVRDGDRNLYRISLLYGSTINEIAAASGIVNPELITIGQRLTIPGCGTTGVVPPPTSLPQADPLTTTNNVTTTQPTAGGTRYVVQQGDSLFQISLQFGVPINSIAAANGIVNIDLIFINQELIIPAA